MSESVGLPTGAPVLVLAAEPCTQALTRVVSDEPPLLAVDAPSLTCPAGRVVTLVFGPRTVRFAARARLAEKRERGWVFERISPWVRFDGRKSARYPVRGMAQVMHAGQTTVARPVDISEGGCGLAVPVGHAPNVGNPVTVALQLFGYSAHLPCVVVGTSPGIEGWVRLHLRFGELAPHQRAFVRTVISASLTAEVSDS